MSVSDLSGRLLEPSTGRLQRLLSNSASTDCCSIRFSLRMITSGAFRSTSFFSRLLRLMMRRYRSFKSLVAKLPESSSTSGRRSGGMTGITSSTIHSGLLSLSRIASTIFSRLIRSLAFCFEPVSTSSTRRSLRQLHQVQILQQLADRLGPHVGLEGAVAVGFAGRAVFFLGQQLLLLERRVAGLGDDVILEVDHLFQAGGLHGQQVAQAAGHGLEEPDVHDRRGQLDVAHPLAADAAVRDLDAAAVADHPLVFHAAVLAAGAFPVLFRAEDPLAEQTVFFRPVGAVVDRFRLLHLAERPTANIVRPGEADLDRCVIVDPIVGAFASTHCSPSVRTRRTEWNLIILRDRRSMRQLRPSTAAGTPTRQMRRFSNCMFSPRPRISLVSTSKLAGVPASSVFSPLTIDS